MILRTIFKKQVADSWRNDVKIWFQLRIWGQYNAGMRLRLLSALLEVPERGWFLYNGQRTSNERSKDSGMSVYDFGDS
jgi:hypothetical protein